MEEGDGEVAGSFKLMSNFKIPESSKDKAELFVVFSRFEFALKENGFVRGGCDEKANPDWDGFAKVVNFAELQKVFSDPDVAELIGKPPQEQVVVCLPDGRKGWKWEDVKERPDEAANKLFLAIRRVRNNLFHGGKHGEDPRDNQLCRAATKILLTCAKTHHPIGNNFQGFY